MICKASLFGSALFVAVCFLQNISAQDPFPPYLNSTPILKELISSTNSGSGSSAITTKRFTFASLNGKNIVFAIMAYPQQAGEYPGVIFFPGAGGNAETQSGNVQTLAQHGYISMTIDVPGISGTTNTPYSTGPWKTKSDMFDVTNGAQNSSLFDAGVAGLEAFNYMRSLSLTDTSKMGVSGSSWGGFLATFLAGFLGNRVQAAWALYGCGFLDKGSSLASGINNNMSAANKNTWLTYIDAGRRCPNMKGSYYLEASSNDFAFWPGAVMATLDAIPGSKNHTWGPNLNHQSIGGPMKQLFFDYYLKGTGKPFVNASISKIEAQNSGDKKIYINAAVPAGVTVDSVRLYYSLQDTNWQGRNWIGLEAKLETGTTYSAVLSAALVKNHVDYYAYIVDTRQVAVASLMYNAFSDPITSVAPEKKGSDPADFSTNLTLRVSQSDVSYTLPRQSDVSINIIDLKGRAVYSIKQYSQSAGPHRLNFGSFDLPTGVYTIRLSISKFKGNVAKACLFHRNR